MPQGRHEIEIPEDSKDTISIHIPPMTRYPAVRQVNQHEDGSQQERIKYIKEKILSGVWIG